MSQIERRCPNCDALVSEDADWCGQCFADLRRSPPPPPAPPVGAQEPALASSDPETALRPTGDPFWPCIVLEVCETCGTPFAAVMRGVTKRDVDAQAALTRSLVFPGAGHAMLGYPIDGFARGVLFVLSVGLVIFLSIAALHTPVMVLAILLMLALAIGVYVLSAMEIKELAARGRLMVPSKFLLWVSVGVMFLVVGAIALSVATSTRR